MKINQRIQACATIAGGIIASWVLLLSTIHAEASSPWLLVDDFQYLSTAGASGVAADGAGSIYVVGFGVSNSVQRALTRKSTDGGLTWTLVDDFAYPNGRFSRFEKVSADGLGNLFVVGWIYDSAGKDHWLVRRSQDAGTIWATVDDYLGPGNGAGGGAWPEGVLALNNGQVYVVGQGAAIVSGGKKPSYANDWVVRRSLDGGTTWTTVDDYEFTPGVANGVSQAQAITASAAGLFVVGSTHGNYWAVRQSTTGNSGSWSTVDVFTNTSGLSAFANVAGVDASGNIYAAGFYDTPYKGSYLDHWLVRRSTNGGSSWTTVDNLASQTGSASGFALDSLNNIVVVGSDESAGSWVTRNSPTGDPGTWLTTDEYPSASPRDVCRDSAGNLFAVGAASGASGEHWLVRKQPAY